LARNKAAINEPQLWISVREVLDCLTGAVCLLKKADSDHLMCGKLWKLLNDAHLRLKGMEETNPKLVGVADLFYKRWEYLHHPIYSLAHVLYPDNNEANPLGDESIQTDVSKMLKRFFPLAAERARVQCSIDQYLHRQGHFSTLDDEGVGCLTRALILLQGT